MIRPRHISGLLALILSNATLADGLRLHHAVIPGRLVDFDITIESTRDRRAAGEWTQVRDRQQGRLVRYVLTAGDDRAQRIEMLSLSPADVVSATRDGVGISPRPSASELGLDSGGVYMTVAEISEADAPALVPGGSDPRLVGVALLMAAPRWPPNVAGPWTSPVTMGETELLVTWRLSDDAPKADGDEITLNGSIDESADASAGDARAITMRATMRWDASAGVAALVDGTARYRVAKPRFDETYTVRVELTRRRADDLEATARREMRDSILALNAAIAANRRGEREVAERDARAFVEKWPDSPWRPTINRLLDDLSRAGAAPPEIPGDAATPADLLAALSQAMKSWQDADRAADDATRARLRATLSPLVAGAQDDVRALLQASDPGPRAAAAFALAFTDDGLDLLALQEATGDADGRVRAWAAYALSIRADARTEFRTLQLLARDDDANVRARACEAVAACVPPDSRDARAARMLLLDRLADDFDGVRLHAAIALMTLAQPADLPRIKDVRDVEPSEVVVEALDRLIGRLEQRE